MSNYIIGMIEFYAEALRKIPEIGDNLPRLLPGAAERVAEEVGEPLATSPDELARHLAITKAYYKVNTPPWVPFVQGKDRKSTNALQSKAKKLLDGLPRNFRDPVLHILSAADREFRDEIEEFKYQAPKVAKEIRSRAEDPSADAKAFEAMAAQMDALTKNAERIAGYGNVEILERIQRMRSDLDYVQRLVDIYKEREANWKPRPLTGLAALGAVYAGKAKVEEVRMRSSDEDEQTYDPWAGIFGIESDPLKAMRRQIVGDWLPAVFNHHFAPYVFKIGGWDHDKGARVGPGIRFLVAATREMGIVQEDGSLWSTSTLAGDCQSALERKEQLRSVGLGATKLH